MEWQEFLQKSSLTDRQKELAKEITDGDNEDHKNLFAKKLEPKEASWESWLDKNNAIETSHKDGEEKHEWDGKFSSSTIRDDAKNDDEKSESEEESLEELTDGKLEEIEKLKSWEVFLKAINATGGLVQNKREIDIGEKKPAIHNSGSNLKNSKIATHGQGVEAKDSQRNAITGKLPLIRGTLGNPLTEKPHKTSGRTIAQGGDVPTKGGGKPKIDGEKGMKEGSKDLTEGAVTYSPSEVTATGTHRVTQRGTREILQHEQDREDAIADGWNPDTGLKNQPPTKDQKDQSELTPINRAWEMWLNKFTPSNSDKELLIEIDTARQTGLKKIPKQRTKPESGVDAKEDEISLINAEKWKSWLEKQQGAGDARFGNQHLTGMEQHPVADDDSLELSPETEENNEKQDKKEDKEDKNNKPYKALR